MSTRRLIAILGTVLVAASCSDQKSPAEVERAAPEAPVSARQASSLLTNVPLSLIGGSGGQCAT